MCISVSIFHVYFKGCILCACLIKSLKCYFISQTMPIYRHFTMGCLRWAPTVLLLMLRSYGSGVPLASFYPFGSSAGDTSLGPTNDGTSPPILLPSPFTFFGSPFSTLYVSQISLHINKFGFHFNVTRKRSSRA